MAIALRSSGQALVAGTSATVTKPAGVVVGDVLYAWVSSDESASTGAPTGWTSVFSGGATGRFLRIWRKVATSSEPANYAFTVGTATNTPSISIIIAAFTGVNNTTPEDVAVGATNVTTASKTAAAPSVTTVTAGAMVLCSYTIRETSGTTITTTPPTGMTEMQDVQSGWLASELSYLTQASAGATGTKTATANLSSTWTTSTLALRPGTAVADTTAPSVPTGLTATASSPTQVNLSWTAATDNVGVASYLVFRDGVQINSTFSTTYTDSTAVATTTYSYTVKAVDAAGNTSAASTAASVTTPTPTAGVPSYAGSRSNPWDAASAVYNLSLASTTGIRAAMATTGTARVKLLGIGHSEMAGEGSAIGTTDMPVTLRKKLATAGVPVGGSGIVYAKNDDVRDSRWVVGTGSWARDPSADNPFYTATTSGSIITFTSDVAGTVVDVATYGISGAFTVTIDSGAAQAVTPNGQSAVQIVSFTGLTNSTHTVKITTTSATATYLIGAGVRNGTTGFEVTNAGYSGTMASDWSPTLFSDTSSAWFNPYNTALNSAASPTMAMVQLDANEALQGVAVSTYKANMQTLLTALRTANIPFFLIASPSMVPGGGGYNAVTQATWNSFLSAEYDLADQYNVPLVDATARFGTWAAANTNGWMFDQVHPSGSGYNQIATQAATVLNYTGAAPVAKAASVTGTWTFTGTAGGKRAPKASSTGSWVFAGSSSGKEAPKASSTGAWTFAGTSSGKQAPKSSASGSWAFTGISSGKQVPKASATGAWTFAGSSAGKRTPKASATGSWVFAGTSSGKRAPKASATGAWVFSSTALTSVPIPGVKKATVLGSWRFTGDVQTKRASTASATGTWTFTGVASGSKPGVAPRGATVAGAWGFTGVAIGKRAPRALAVGTWRFQGSSYVIGDAAILVWDGDAWVPAGVVWDGQAWQPVKLAVYAAG